MRKYTARQDFKQATLSEKHFRSFSKIGLIKLYSGEQTQFQFIIDKHHQVEELKGCYRTDLVFTISPRVISIDLKMEQERGSSSNRAKHLRQVI